jgi:hypothetical protein
MVAAKPWGQFSVEFGGQILRPFSWSRRDRLEPPSSVLAGSFGLTGAARDAYHGAIKVAFILARSRATRAAHFRFPGSGTGYQESKKAPRQTPAAQAAASVARLIIEIIDGAGVG